MIELEDLYIQYAEAISRIASLEIELHNKKRLIADFKENLVSPESDGGFGIEFTAHAFKQINERLEKLALEYSIIYKDVFKEDAPSESLLLASNMKSFIITLLANARKNGEFKAEPSKNSNGGTEYRFTVDIKRWSIDKTLQFVGIVENNHLKTGFFNWV